MIAVKRNKIKTALNRVKLMRRTRLYRKLTFQWKEDNHPGSIFVYRVTLCLEPNPLVNVLFGAAKRVK